MESYAMTGRISTDGSDPNNPPFFMALFYETQPRTDNVVDWVRDIGPTLKQMGLLYPSMQKIINLYEFQSVSMRAMRRAFDIEDEDNTRYMPATRELSKLEHR